ncbi:zinc-binding alcohol dehydrogenase [Candidatus Poribacteria bacterium]|nr:zinc-binding alcohol dehydrogenase [Candidatus Poribacteria bacterium]
MLRRFTMPLELVAIEQHKPILREYADSPLAPNQVRFKPAFAAAKHGTELGLYKGLSVDVRQRYDGEWQMFFPEAGRNIFPVGLGNMAVGVVAEVGSSVKKFKPSDRVFCHTNFRQTVTRNEDNADLRHLPEGMSWKAAVCIDPAEFALGAVRDGHVRVGDAVAVFGLGAIGLFIVQFARMQGAEVVFGVDPINLRREVAMKIGADAVFDPNACDASYEIKKATNKRGADVNFEVSGNYNALHHAIRSVAFGGNVVAVAVYKEAKGGLELGAEWHINRPHLISSRACSDPNRDHPRWNDSRIIDTCFRFLRDGKLQTADIVQPVVPFKDSVEAYIAISEHPERSIKLGVEF